MWLLHAKRSEIEENQFENMEEINDFLQARINDPKPKTKTIRHSKDEAQELIYAALESVGKDRYRLAQKALALNPFHADGYTILAEQADSLQSAAKLFKKGMLAGREELGEEFFKENKGEAQVDIYIAIK